MIVDIFISKSKTISVIILILFLLSQSTAFTQSGAIKGKVYDRESKNPLVGTNIIVKGTSLGAAADINGNFIIRNIPAGNHIFIISYIGYNTDTVFVKIIENKTIDRDFNLDATAYEGKTVVITGQAQGQVSAIQQQLSSNKIVNVVSEARIQELPDFNAAAAIGRLPGVSTLQSSGEANKIVVRGLAPQFNAVAVGGISLASTGSTQIGAASQGGTSYAINTDRSVDLTMVTPYMIKSIEVYKSLTPDMNANAIGGYVNMNLREAPTGWHGDALWQSGYTQKSTKYSNYRAVVSASNRFFNDMLGVYILGNVESYDRNSDNMNASYKVISTVVGASGYRPVQVTTVTLNRHIETRNRYGGNVILDYMIPGGSIKSVNMFSRLNSDYADYNTLLNYDTKSIGFNYGAGDKNTDLAVNSLELTQDYGFISMDIKAANTYSRNHNPNSPFFQFSQDQSYSAVPADTPPEKLTTLVSYKGADKVFSNSISLFTSDYKENDQVYKGDFKIPLNFEALVSTSGFVKFGGEYRYNFHSNQQGTPYALMRNLTSTINQDMLTAILARFNVRFDSASSSFPGSNFTNPNQDIFSSFLDNKYGSIYWAADGSMLNNIINYISTEPAFSGTSVGGWQDGLYQNLPNNYKYIEKYYAAYIMSELNFGTDLMVVGGVRFEQDKSLFEAYNLVDLRNPVIQKNATFPITVYPQNHYWLPMVQAKYTPTEWCDLRYSFTQTLARPDYSQISPHFNISTDFNNIWAGNPHLKPAQAYNHDVEITFHGNELGLLSISGFYKTVKNFTYSTQYKLLQSAPPGFDSVGSFNPAPNLNATLYTFINSPYDAVVKGIETDFQTRLWYLPFPFSGVTLGINYTHIWSSATYPYLDTRSVTNPAPPPRYKTILVDSTRDGRLINQPNDVVNAYLGYDFMGFSARLSFLFQGNSVSYVGNFPEQDAFTKDYFRIDASFKQELPWEGINVYLDLNSLNNATNVSAQKSIGAFTTEQYYGLTANLGIRYKL